MIVRMWEARLVPGTTGAFVAFWTERVRPRLTATDGCLDAELVVSYGVEPGADERAVVTTRWRDEAALAAAAGPDWRVAPVVEPGEAAFLARPAYVWHFRPA